jgi:dTDP-4-dehydrorhamnose 3,5-epimerase
MKVFPTKFSDSFLIQPDVHKDHRGFFMESFCQYWFKEKNIDVNFIQDNHSLSADKGVLRGLHFQLPPRTQTKLIRVIHGAVFDVIVDLRKESPTYRQWQSFELSNANELMLFIPKGFAHGFCTIMPNTEFMYKVDEYYSPEHEGGIQWNDPLLNIPWPIAKPILSERDKKWPSMANLNLFF